MFVLPSDIHMEDHSIPLDIIFPDQGEDGGIIAEEESLPIVEKIVPRCPNAKTDLQKAPEVVTERFKSAMTTGQLTELKVRLGLPGHVDLIPAGNDKVQIHRPDFCALYTYPFLIGYSFPLPSLIEDLCRYYNLCPTQLAPYIFKVAMILMKFSELAIVDNTVHHLIHLFAPHFYRGTLLNLHHRGGKCLVVRMDDKASRHFWLDYFFVKREDVVSTAADFLRFGTLLIIVCSRG
nr:uncharacterized protein LOC104093758 isoform X1 [Nicotiana tomentosiformis]